MKDKIFGALQKIGRSFMVPIAVLPIAGLFLGIGSSFTNPNSGFFSPDGFMFKLLSVLSDSGNIVFTLLPLLFCAAVALGLAKQYKEVAAISAVIAYFVMNMTISSMVKYFLNLEELSKTPGLISDFLGFENTMNTSVLGGVILGFVISWLHNKYYKIKLPELLSFFGGLNFIPIISVCFSVIFGIILAIIWPFIAQGIALVGEGIANLGSLGTFLYGFIYRALIPTGLHHVFYIPFWQTALGGVAEINGQVFNGAQSILFEQLRTGDVISPSVARFYSGEYAIMMFGLPAAALAMYHTALKKNKEKVKGLLLSAGLVSFLTGITEPIEFTFLFISPILYFGIHCVLSGLSFVFANLLHVGVGYSFSAGVIDFIIYGVIPGNDRTNWTALLILGVIYAFVYYFIFKFFILKWKLKTPGREDSLEEVKLHTKSDYLSKSKNQNKGKETDSSENILEGLGGLANINEIGNCATRLRVNVIDGEKVSEDLLKQTGAVGVFKKGNNVQVIYGPSVGNIRTKLDEYIQVKKIN